MLNKKNRNKLYEIINFCIFYSPGVWAPRLGRQAGVNVPLIAMKHAYVNTEPIEGIFSLFL